MKINHPSLHTPLKMSGFSHSLNGSCEMEVFYTMAVDIFQCRLVLVINHQSAKCNGCKTYFLDNFKIEY